MCMAFEEELLGLLIAVMQRGDGLYVAEFTLLLAKVAERKPGGEHYRRGLTYRIGRWIDDPNYVPPPPDNDRTIHLAPMGAALAGKLNDFGGHILAALPSRRLWSRRQGSARCWHDGAILPVACLTCEGVSVDTLSLPEFWREMKVTLPGPGTVVFPNGLGLLRPELYSPHLFRRQLVIAPRRL